MMEFDNVDGDARRTCPDDTTPHHEGQAVYVTASSTRMDTVRFLHRWTIDQFSVQQELSQTGEFLESSPFGSSNGQYKFRLKLFPCGKDEDCRGYLSLFLQIQKCPTAKLRFRVNFYIETTEGPRGCALNKNVVTINKGGIVTASKFFSMETLKGRPSRFLPDDTLTVGVELTVFGEQSSRELQPDDIPETAGSSAANPGQAGAHSSPNIFIGDVVPTPGEANSTLGNDLNALLLSKDHADLTITVGRRAFRCHRAILAARSPVFAAMFAHAENQEAQTGEATLEEVTAEAFSAMLEFIYTDKCAELNARAPEILQAANMYGLEKLKQLCEDNLVQDLTLNNLCERLRLADSYNAHKIRRRALAMFQRNRTQILESRDWIELEQEVPKLAAAVLKELMTMPDPSARFSSFPAGLDPPAKRPRLS